MANRFLLFFVLTSTLSFSQDTLTLLNGKVKLSEFQSMDFENVYYKEIKKDGGLSKIKKKKLDYVFSINKTDSCIYFYKKDSLSDNYWSNEEMKEYLEGRRQGRKHFKPYKTLLIGAGVGTGLAFYSLFPIRYGEKQVSEKVIDIEIDDTTTISYTDFKTVTIPIPYWEIVPLGVYVYYSSKAGNIDNFEADNMEMFSKEMFVIGYQETVINRKTYSAVGASLGSFLTVMLGNIIFNINED